MKYRKIRRSVKASLYLANTPAMPLIKGLNLHGIAILVRLAVPSIIEGARGMKAFRALTILTATTALAFGTVPAFAEVSGDEAVDATGELPLDDDGSAVTYEEGSAGSDEVLVDPIVDDGVVGEPVEDIEVRDGDPMPYERELDGAGGPEIMYMTGGPAGEDFGSSAADDAAEAAADNAADKALDRVEVASSSRLPSSAE
jgi:hypothetical protein